MMTFSDFPPLAEDTPYFTTQAIHDYYKRYAKAHNLLQCIQFDTRVVKIRKTSDHEKTGQWEVFSCPASGCSPDDVSTENKSKDIDLDKCKKSVFDFVLVCTGFFKSPVYPSIPGLETFTGTVQHSFDYTSSSQYKNKTVLVVGNSFSAGDISYDISTQAKQVHLMLRQGTWIVPRILSGGRPFDNCKRRCDMYSRNPEKIINRILIHEAQDKIDHVTSGICPDQPPSVSAWMIGDGIYTALMSGQIKTYGHLARIDGCDAVFQDGTRVTGLDAIVLCTGYEPDYPFFDQGIIQEFDKMGLFKMVFPIVEEKHTLGFIGAFAGVGAIAPVCELQSRYSAKIFAGKLTLPPVDVMRADVQFWTFVCSRNRNRKYYYYLPCFEFQDTIAKLLGVFPGFWRLLILDPVLAYRCWYGPMFSAQYRLLGPDSNWKQARAICNTAYTEGCLSLRHSKLPRDGITSPKGN
ncbi:flavin-containing monooxygenase 5-like [Physella acuta]|uniref:flavin-containing monooxygenase 5-like n=1 Tax=Physella acuta TaxID=109671 RepID=UPI0027DB94E8|nr:flavin-containing monooxygenase 5-like [Physella acuta]